MQSHWGSSCCVVRGEDGHCGPLHGRCMAAACVGGTGGPRLSVQVPRGEQSRGQGPCMHLGRHGPCRCKAPAHPPATPFGSSVGLEKPGLRLAATQTKHSQCPKPPTVQASQQRSMQHEACTTSTYPWHRTGCPPTLGASRRACKDVLKSNSIKIVCCRGAGHSGSTTRWTQALLQWTHTCSSAHATEFSKGQRRVICTLPCPPADAAATKAKRMCTHSESWIHQHAGGGTRTHPRTHARTHTFTRTHKHTHTHTHTHRGRKQGKEMCAWQSGSHPLLSH